MFCKFCGSQIDENARFCTNCGSSVDLNTDSASDNYTNNANNNAEESRDNYAGRDPMVVANALDRIKTCYIIWMVISIAQIVIGVCTMCVFYGFATLGLGIWNLIQANTMKKNLDVFTYDPGLIYKYYEDRETQLIIMLVVNFLFGAFFGCVAMIVELTVRSYVMQNKRDLS